MGTFFEAIIFDMDGTLLDTERIAWRAWQAAVAEVEVTFPEAFYPSMIGRTRHDYTAMIRDAISHPERIGLLLDAMPRHFQAVMDREGLPLRPGVRETLEWLAARSVPVAVATSSGREGAEHKLKMAGIAEFFVSLTSGDEVARGKPEPDIFLESLRRLDRKPAHCLVVEDSPNGLRAAVAAGLRVVLVPDLAKISPEVAALAWRQFECVDELPTLLPPYLKARPELPPEAQGNKPGRWV